MELRHNSAKTEYTRKGTEGHPPLTMANLSNRERQRLTVIAASRGWFSSPLLEVWRYRYLLWVLVWRDIKVRHKQTVLGVIWAILQPFLTMIVFTFVFGRLAKVPSGDVPYPVFFFCGLLPWQLFASGVVRSTNSLVENRYLVTRVYLPRLVLPAAAVLGGLPDFIVAFVLLLAIMAYYGIMPSLAILGVLPLLILLVATALAVGLFLAALNVRYRDVGYAVPFLIQLWFLMTPVAYPTILAPSRWQFLYELNPITSVVDGFRWVLLGSRGAPGTLNMFSVLAAVGALMLGLFYFQHVERTFADVV